MERHKWRFFFVMSYATSFFYGEIGAFAAIKYPMSEELSFSPSFLGFLDSLRYLGYTLGTVYSLIFPFREPKKAFVILTLAKSITLMMIVFLRWTEEHTDIYCSILMFGLGFLKLQHSLIYYIIGQFFDSKTQQTELNLSSAVGFFGDFFTLYLAKLIIQVLGFHWTTFMVFFSFLLSISMMLVHKYVDEYPIEYEAADSLTESVKSKLANMKLIFYHPKRAIAVIENVLFIGLYYNMLIWFPYYFTEIGYASYATHLSVITPFLTFFGCLGFESLIKVCQSYSHWFISALLLVSTFCQFQLTWLAEEPNTPSTIKSFLLLIFVSSLCLSGPLNTIFMTEQSSLTSDSRVAAMYIFIVHSLLCRMFIMGSMLVIGTLLQRNKYSFFWFIFLNVLAIAVIDVARNVFFDRKQIYLKKKAEPSEQLIEMVEK